MQTYNLSTPGTDSRMLTQQSPDSSTVAGRGSNTLKCKTGNQTFPEMSKLKLWHPLSLLGTSCQLNHFPARCFSPGSKARFRLCSSKARVMNYSPCCLLFMFVNLMLLMIAACVFASKGMCAKFCIVDLLITRDL